MTLTGLCTASVFMLVTDNNRGPLNNYLFFQDLVANGALVSICNKYGEMPVDKAKAPLRELLRGPFPTPSLCSLVPSCIFSFYTTLKAKTVFLPQNGQRRWARISTVFHTRIHSGRGPLALGPVSHYCGRRGCNAGSWAMGVG